MTLGDIGNSLKEIIPPAGLFSIAITYIISRINESIKKKNDLISKQVSLIDTLIIGLDKIDAIFESLRIDAENNNYFAFKNINKAKPVVDRMQKLVDEIIILSDSEIRREVLKIIDALSSLIEDVNSLENLASMENDNFKASQKKYVADLRTIKKDFLQEGIILEGLAPKFSSKSGRQNSEILQTAQELVNSVTSELQESQNNNDFLVNKYLKDKRFFFAMRIIDAQAKSRNLNDKLANMRNKLSGHTK